MKPSLVALLSAVFTNAAIAQKWEESPTIAELFEKAEVKGTFVVHDPDGQLLRGHNEERARTRFIPASTFKIPHSLIGLSTRAVASVEEVLPYGGKPQKFKQWEEDMSLRKAITMSNVPVYQGLARRIGLKQEREHLARLNYGNADPGTSVDTFWLNGPLKISAVEQTAFLGKLARRKLPYTEEHQQAVAEIVLLEETTTWTLHGKTGWQNAPKPGVGWWVGWVNKGGRIYPFALNLEIQRDSDADKRVALGKASLKALGILE